MENVINFPVSGDARKKALYDEAKKKLDDGMKKKLDRYGEVMIDRLTLTPERIAGMAQGVREVAELPYPEAEATKE